MSADQSRETETFNPEASGLTLRFADGFDQEFEAPNHLDMAHWTNCQGGAKAENGCCVLDAVIAPGEWGDAGICTREKQFNPGLKGTNGVEVTFMGHTQQGEPHNYQHPEHIGNPLGGPYIAGMCLTIANYPGPIVPDMDADVQAEHEQNVGERDESGFRGVYKAIGKRRSARRGVQIHFDFMEIWGLDYFFCRDILPEDYGKYPEWDVHLDTIEELMAQGQYVGGAPFVLAGRHHRPDQTDHPLGRRYGLYLTDDGNTVSWTLDGKIMDTVDISGFFTSDPECVGDGAYISLSGAGYQPHLWMFDDLKVYSS